MIYFLQGVFRAVLRVQMRVSAPDSVKKDQAAAKHRKANHMRGRAFYSGKNHQKRQQ
jgi:hypothetical protein